MTAAALTRAEAEELLYREARLLDERRLEEWLGLFTADARYWIPGGEAAEPGTEVAIVDDDRPTLEDRVTRLRSPATHAQSPPSRTLHLVGNVEVEPVRAEPAAVRVHSVQVIYESRAGQVRSFAARCEHLLVRDGAAGGAWRIAEKRVYLVDRDLPQYNLTFLL
jgi:3-phenylpropionate/cinnamic acid dioxygenase small subunit